MKKKIRYISPEIVVIRSYAPAILAGSENDKPYVDAKPYVGVKQHPGFKRSNEWEDKDDNPWRSVCTYTDNGLPKAKDLWE